MIANWIYEENLQPFLEILGLIIDYQFDPAEIVLIQADVRESDGDADCWFEYQMPGVRYSCHIRLAHDLGTHVIQLQIDLPALANDQVAVVVHILQTYHIRPIK